MIIVVCYCCYHMWQVVPPSRRKTCHWWREDIEGGEDILIKNDKGHDFLLQNSIKNKRCHFWFHGVLNKQCSSQHLPCWHCNVICDYEIIFWHLRIFLASDQRLEKCPLFYSVNIFPQLLYIFWHIQMQTTVQSVPQFFQVTYFFSHFETY